MKIKCFPSKLEPHLKWLSTLPYHKNTISYSSNLERLLIFHILAPSRRARWFHFDLGPPAAAADRDSSLGPAGRRRRLRRRAVASSEPATHDNEGERLHLHHYCFVYFHFVQECGALPSLSTQTIDVAQRLWQQRTHNPAPQPSPPSLSFPSPHIVFCFTT